ncbi:hypothetical protein [Thalassotalea mangrovi]|uniref:Lipoprotein n=1 Tax=Thalassotalea mangrovi TaxID=2572245 RepID=A0A4U1B9M2_9GAMM|nr:hypothetical protein [Thalassotalea mangrovi]TKB47084.1 hypothetical protein E8M12_02165 [Thalassotalea mangrovi]
MRAFAPLLLITLTACSSSQKSVRHQPVVDISSLHEVSQSSLSFDDIPAYERPLSYKIDTDNPIFHNETIAVHRGIQAVSGTAAKTPKFIATEVASNWHYWMIEEAQRLFTASVSMAGETSSYQPHIVDNGPILDLGPKPSAKKESISALLIRYVTNVDEKTVDKVFQRCIDPVGSKTLAELTLDQQKAFYRHCFTQIRQVVPQGVIAEIDNHPFETPYPYNELTIRRHFVYEEQGYGANFIKHLQGEYGAWIQTSLQQPDYNQVVVSLPSDSALLSDDRLFNQEYFTRTLNPKAFDDYALTTLFNSEGMADIYPQQEADAFEAEKTKQDEASLPISKTLLRPLPALCSLDPTVYHMAISGAYSRFQFDCFSEPKLIPEDEWQGKETYKSYVWSQRQVVRSARYSAANHYPNVIRSKATYLRFNDDAIQTSKTGFQRQTLILFDVMPDGVYEYQKVDKNFPIENQNGEQKTTSIFALELLKRLPPNAMVAWIGASSTEPSNHSSYVFHHGFLWEFPLQKFSRFKGNLLANKEQ